MFMVNGRNWIKLKVHVVQGKVRRSTKATSDVAKPPISYQYGIVALAQYLDRPEAQRHRV
jgi:hypothetical protein